jgi:tetratricopeptide (TPR) repeat protein
VLAVLVEKIKKKSALPIVLSVVVIFIFTFMASLHSDSFKDSQAFFTAATDKGNPGACTKRGEMYMGERNFASAIADFNMAVDLSKGEYAPAFFNRGMYNSQVLKDHAAAEADLTRAVMVDTSFIDAYIQRAAERIFSSNFAGAIADLDKAESFDNTRFDIYYSKAKVYTSALQFKDALPFFNKAISMYGYSAEIYNDRAYVRYRVKDYNGALKDCNKAIRLVPNFMSAYYNKGIIYLETGKPKIALAELDTTLALTNNFYFGYFYRGMAKKALHDMKGACADWQESVRLGFTMAQDTLNKYCK